jgi:hypothetical protein
MQKPLSPYAGMLNAANEQYHGVCSINQHGEINHAHKLAEIAMREQLVSTEQQAVAWANQEIQRLHANIEGDKIHRTARDELRAEAQQPEWVFQP